MKWTDLATFEGTWSLGQPFVGIFKWPTGDVYKGTWVNNMPQGRGNLKFSSGTSYSGQISVGMQHGLGKET